MGDKKVRLYTIYTLCKENIDKLENCEITSKYENGKSVTVVRRWLNAKEALSNLCAIKAFKTEIMKIYEAVPTVYRDADWWENYFNSYSFAYQFGKIKDKLQAIIDVYESFGFEEQEIGIDVKLPDGDFSEFIGNVRSLEFIINQCPVLKREDGEIKFSNVDVGSTWLSFFVIGGGALMLAKSFAALLDKAIILKSHYTQTKMQEEQLRAMKLGNDTLEASLNTFKLLNENYMDDALDALEKEGEPYKNGEERDKTKKTLEKLIDLLDKGVEIYSSASSPKEIQLLFPTLETEKLLTSEDIKLLTKKEDE